MNAHGKSRKPAAFVLADPRIRVAEDESARHATKKAQIVVTPESDNELPAIVPPAAAPPRRRWLRWGMLFWTAALGLAALALGIAVVKLIEDLFNRSQTLGVLGLIFAAIAGIALAAILLREAVALVRLASVDAVRARAAAAVASDNRVEGQAVVGDLLQLTRRMPRLARSRARLDGHREDIIDGRDLVFLAERELMAPLDADARRLIGAAAKRVSVITAVSPRAAIDIIFVLVNALGLIRRLAGLYGTRPGLLGLLRLLRHVVSHLAVTGGMAATDSLIQQVIGHGLAAKLSARLGEGVLNGLLTARLGLAAMDVTRPLPFSALPRPSLNDLAGGLLRSSDGKVAERNPGPAGRSQSLTRRKPAGTYPNCPVVSRFDFRLSTQSGPLSAGRWLAGENRQLSVESTLVGGPRFAAGDIGGEVRIFVQDARSASTGAAPDTIIRSPGAERAIEPVGIAKAIGKLAQPFADAIVDQGQALRACQGLSRSKKLGGFALRGSAAPPC